VGSIRARDRHYGFVDRVARAEHYPRESARGESMNTEDFVLATIWATGGLILAFYLYATFSPRIQKPQPQTARPSA
jgi:hypothetical protein